MNYHIFTSDEIVDICKAFAMAETNEYLNENDILCMNNEEASRKIDSLPESIKKKFIKQIEISVQEQLALFNSTPDKINSDEALLENQSILKEVYCNWEYDFKDYIKND